MTRVVTLVVVWLGVVGVGGQLTATRAAELIDSTWAARHGLTRAWFGQAQLDPARGRITHLGLAEGTLLVQTSRGLVQAMDAQTGQPQWSMQVGTPGYPDMPADAHGDYVAAVNGSTLYILNRYDGKLLWQKKLEGPPGAGPGLSDHHVYVALVDGLVYAYPLKPMARPEIPTNDEGEKKKSGGSSEKPAAKAPASAKAQAKAGAGSTAAATGIKAPAKPGAEPPAAGAGAAPAAKTAAVPVSPEDEQKRRSSLRLSQETIVGLACSSIGQVFTRPLVTAQSTGEENIAWTTSRGYLFMGRLFENRFSVTYRLSTGGPMSTEPTYLPRDANITGDSGVIYGASEDGFVYAIRQTDGKLLWRFSTGEPITERLAVIGLRIYVPTRTEGMFCLNAETGEHIWTTPNVRRFIAASRDRLYTIDQVGWMVVLNAQTGARLDSFDVSGTPIRLTNDVTDRIYLASPSGLIQCLHEIDAPEPIRHREILIEQRAKLAEERAAQEAAKPQAAPATPEKTAPAHRAAAPKKAAAPVEKPAPAAKKAPAAHPRAGALKKALKGAANGQGAAGQENPFN